MFKKERVVEYYEAWIIDSDIDTLIKISEDMIATYERDLIRNPEHERVRSLLADEKAKLEILEHIKHYLPKKVKIRIKD